MFKTLHKRPNSESIGSKLTGCLQLILGSLLYYLPQILQPRRRPPRHGYVQIKGTDQSLKF